ncbi:MAG: alkylated DNA repair dioxygenase AlkB [Candidatus Latescibacterota bacterium]|jgi:alkylated DNA repair dioxygenase AlkB
MEKVSNFQSTELSSGDLFWAGSLPVSILKRMSFDALWDLHPVDFSEILIHGRRVKTPRWGQAFGRDYRFSGQLAQSDPIPPFLNPVLEWVCEAIDGRLNGLLLNWYDGSLGHYIGKHRDKTTGMVVGTPIVTVSFGEARVFRLREWKGTESVDFVAENGSVFIVPYEMNKRWTHEIPKAKRYLGKRVSVTVRAFG